VVFLAVGRLPSICLRRRAVQKASTASSTGILSCKIDKFWSMHGFHSQTCLTNKLPAMHFQLLSNVCGISESRRVPGELVSSAFLEVRHSLMQEEEPFARRLC